MIDGMNWGFSLRIFFGGGNVGKHMLDEVPKC